MTANSILITGCSSGIGLDAARTLHTRGWRVFATCRAEADCDRLRAEGLESFRLDYDDEASVEAAVAEVVSRTGGTLDALFNNGAYAIPCAMAGSSTTHRFWGWLATAGAGPMLPRNSRLKA